VERIRALRCPRADTLVTWVMAEQEPDDADGDTGGAFPQMPLFGPGGHSRWTIVSGFALPGRIRHQYHILDFGHFSPIRQRSTPSQ
jgi:hypothetical protein